MDLQRINVKFFVENPDGILLTDFIRIFNSWIQASDGEYYDIADYHHVHAGPGVLLIAHEANISIDNTGNRLGLLYNRKQPLSGNNREKLDFVFRSALEFCRRIEEEPAPQGKIKFGGNEFLFLINDRLLAPNSAATFRAVSPDLEKIAKTLYAGAEFLMDHRNDAREIFAVKVKSLVHFEVLELLHNLQDHGELKKEGSWDTTRSLSK
ncbi:MAG: hypothetical protein A2253_12010 [Deltaproteobacteria bacterium RIFOXYA2_FULL_55_11]|nr:MAG: hypothetical protein A2253_12010 [Deltaproteobacteria bacterium RIFOXYA2_FULL_55_11]